MSRAFCSVSVPLASINFLRRLFDLHCRSVDNGYGLPWLLKIRSFPTAETISARINPLFLNHHVLLDETGAFQREGYPDVQNVHLATSWLLRTRIRVLEPVLGRPGCRKYPVLLARRSEGVVPFSGNPF